MTPNPTARPFVLGALLFLCLLVGWPGESRTAAPARARCEILVNNRTPFRVLVHVDGVYYGWVNMQQSFTFKGIAGDRPVVYGTTQYAEYFWGPKVLKCRDQASWELAF
jgi:hypothetical protein